MLPSFCAPVLVCLRQVTASCAGLGVFEQAPSAPVGVSPAALGAALEKPNVIFLLGGKWFFCPYWETFR